MSCHDKYIFWVQDPRILYKNNKLTEFIPTAKMNRVDQLNATTRFCIYFIILALFTNKSVIWTQIPIMAIFFIILLYYVYKIDKEGMKDELYRMRGIDVNGLGDKDYPENKDETQENVAIESGYYDSDNRLMIGKYLSSKPPKNKKLKFNLDDYTAYEKSICRKPTKENPFMNPLLNDITTDNPEAPIVACNADDEDVNDKITECYNEDLYRDIEDVWERHNSQRQFYTIAQTYPNDQKAFADFCYKNDNICKVDQSKCLKNEDLRFKRLAQLNY